MDPSDPNKSTPKNSKDPTFFFSMFPDDSQLVILSNPRIDRSKSVQAPLVKPQRTPIRVGSFTDSDREQPKTTKSLVLNKQTREQKFASLARTKTTTTKNCATEKDTKYSTKSTRNDL
jgi:hypothetical protein